MSQLLLMGSRKKAWQKLVSLFGGSSIVEIWPLDETAGTVARGVVNGYNGAYSGGVTLGALPSRVPGAGCPYFDGTGIANLYSAGLAAAFNPAEMTVIALLKMDAAVIADTVTRYAVMLRADTNNRTMIEKNGPGSAYLPRYYAAGTTESGSITTTDAWTCLGYTVSKAAEAFEVYFNGAPAASTTTLGIWTGALAATTTLLGGASTSAPTWIGYMSHVILLNRPATVTEMAQANQMLGG